MKWLTNWGYRKKHTIKTTAGTGTNYPVKIKVFKNNMDDWIKYTDNPIAPWLHPDVHYFENGLNGYKYWMLYTPYPPDNVEHPCIKHSNDGLLWDDDGINNPVVSVGTKYDSDPDMVYIEEYNKWFMVYCIYPDTEGAIHYIGFAWSDDCITWHLYDGVPINGNTNPAIMNPEDEGGEEWEQAVGAMSMFYEDGTFYLYYGCNADFANCLVYGLITFTWNNTTNDIENFQRYSGNPLFDLPATDYYQHGCGHLDVTKYGDTYYGLCMRVRKSGTIYDQCLITSTDKYNWTFVGSYVDAGAYGDWDYTHRYRACYLSDGECNQVLINGHKRIYYSACMLTRYSIGILQDDFFEDQVNLDGHCNSDFSDLRFTDSDGYTELDYWIESKVDDDYAIVWVKIPGDLSSDDQSIYLYYGNSGASSNSDITDIFSNGSDGNNTNLTEVVGGSAIFSRDGDKLSVTGCDEKSDYWATGFIFPEDDNSVIVCKDILSIASNQTIRFAVYDVDSVHESIGTLSSEYIWRSICYGNGLFVAISETNKVMTSPDGEFWVVSDSASTNTWRSVCWSEDLGLFAAVSSTGTGNRVMTSPDGLNWTSRTSAADNDWYSICWGNGLFVSVSQTGTGNRVMTSPDGENWTIQTSAADISWYGVCYGSGLYVAVGTGTTVNNCIMTSPDGINWSLVTISNIATFRSVCYSGSLFVAVGASGIVFTSPDGSAWTKQTTGNTVTWTSVCYGNGLFVAVGSGGTGEYVMTSPDGVTWTSVVVGKYSWSGICYGDGLFVAINYNNSKYRAMSSPDASTWTLRFTGNLLGLMNFGFFLSSSSVYTLYRDTAGSLHYWNFEWVTYGYSLSYIINMTLKIWSDGTNIYFDAISCGKSSLIEAYGNDLPYIPLADIKAFTKNKYIILGKNDTDNAITGASILCLYSKKYIETEPEHEAWSDAEAAPSVTIVYPNGGEILYTDDICNITWNNNLLEHLQLLISMNNGSDWTELVPSIIASAELYAWTIQEWAISDQCLIKAIGIENPEYYDQSDSVFDIRLNVIESIDISYPNGGETFYYGETCTITWTSVGLDHVQILYSKNNGNTWNTIVASVEGSLGTYDWLIPEVAVSDECLIKIIGVELPAYYDISDSVFEVKTDIISSWTQVAAQLNSQTSINTLLLTSDNFIYGGTSPNSRLFRWNGSKWVQIADTIDYETDILTLIEYAGNIYAGTAQGGRLFRLS